MVKNSFCFDRSLIALHISSSTESDVTMYCAPAMWRSVLRQNISDRLTRGLFPQGFAGEMSIFSFFLWLVNLKRSLMLDVIWCSFMICDENWCWHVGMLTAPSPLKPPAKSSTEERLHFKWAFCGPPCMRLPTAAIRAARVPCREIMFIYVYGSWSVLYTINRRCTPSYPWGVDAVDTIRQYIGRV